MIFVGSRDGREGLGLVLGVGREMEDTELEEGEACYYHNNDDSTIDPDVTLSYLDEKLQDVLGHFQKDFEGGVSAENLGAKFGGYGSFLRAYQRSPAWSHPRTPPRVHNNIPRSPNNLHPEGGRHNSVASSCASLSARLGPASATVASVSALRASSVNDLQKQDARMSSTCGEESSSRCELVNKSANPSDQKTLKVRIKVGSDNLSTRKNAEIYSGLGLDVSPSSSLDDSPTGSEALSREPQDAPGESPTSILQIMTSFPVHGSLLLSPLPHDLIFLTEKEKLRGDSRSGPVHMGSHESSGLLVNGTDSGKCDRKYFGEKKPNLSEKNVFSTELKICKGDDARNGIGVLMKKETEIDSLACEELVYNALKLPLVANSYPSIVDSTKGPARIVEIARAANKGGVKEEYFSDPAKDEPLEQVSTLEIGWDQKPNGKVGSAGNVWENKKANSHDDGSFHSRKEGNLKGEKTDVSAKADSNVSKGRKALNTELVDISKQKAGQKATSYEEHSMKLAPVKEHSSSGGKKKSKGSHSHGERGAEMVKDGLGIDSSSVPKNGKSTHANHYMSKSEPNFKKDNGKARDRYKDFFGDLELEQGDTEIALEEMPSADRLKDSEMIQKSTFEFNSTSKERLNGKQIDKPSTLESYARAALNVAPVTGNGPISDVAPATVAPLEDWVCCDKCQAWRLLPPGTNPDSLPEKWLCSMLNWLPGMNRCGISEEETTKALRAHYQIPAPAPESQSTQHGHPGGLLSGVSSADAWHFDQSHQHPGLKAVPTGGRKKHGLKDVANATNQDGPMQFPNSVKKNLQPSLKSKSLNGVNHSPPVNEHDFQNFGQLTNLVVEKHKHEQKETNKLSENFSDGGDPKNLKIINKRGANQECFRASKKIKRYGMHYTDDDWTSNHGGAILKGSHSSSSGLSANASGKDRRKYNKHPKDAKCDSKDSYPFFVRNPEDQNQISSDDRSLHVRKRDDKYIMKKRKVNEGHDNEICTVSFPSAGHHLQGSRDFMEGTSENDHRKEKKARVSKSDGKETGASKGNGGTNRKGKGNNQQLGPDPGSALSQQSLDAIDPLKRDLGSVQPSVAATSSSSKVSGSHKNKASLQEVKGSPVESVSSSPLRILNPEKFASTRRDIVGKDHSRAAGFLATSSPRRCSDGEDDGMSHLLGKTRKDETFAVTHHGSLEFSVFDFQDRDLHHVSGNKAKAEIVSSPGIAAHHVADGNANTLGQGIQYPCKLQASDQCRNEDRRNDNQYHANGSRPRKSGKVSSSRSKDKNWSSTSEFDKGEVNASDSVNEPIDYTSYEEKSKAPRNKFQEKSVVKSDKVEKNFLSKKDSAGKLLSESARRESKSKFGGYDGSVNKEDSISSQDLKQSLLLDRDGERSSKRFLSDRIDRVEGSGRSKSHSLPPSGRGQNETISRCPRPTPGSPKENGANILLVDGSEADDMLKPPKQIKNAENQIGSQPTISRHPTPNGHKLRDLDALQRDSSCQAATNALKEAKDLKHLADRLKNSGSSLESTGLYFQAALKFLHGASLLESCNSESAKYSEIYSSTAKLCEFCAHEYEKSKDMAAAALAYKCMEVAHMRVIYSSRASASRDRHELQMALPIVPPGESPSSSASDVDNLNNPATADKVTLAKGVSPPQVAGNLVTAAQNRSSFVRLLDFARDVNFAMEASRRSRIAFAATNPKQEESQHREGISSVKRALDFNFQDVEKLLRLVKEALNAISR